MREGYRSELGGEGEGVGFHPCQHLCLLLVACIHICLKLLCIKFTYSQTLFPLSRSMEETEHISRETKRARTAAEQPDTLADEDFKDSSEDSRDSSDLLFKKNVKIKGPSGASPQSLHYSLKNS